jgi:A/G-specific adenine glycosylase
VDKLAGRLDLEPLNRWYSEKGRTLPWRETTNPYLIWVSEIMLQQTQVDTVAPYFQRFCTRYPDLAQLAAASEDEVLKLWEGLGYYARARNLLSAARQIMAHHNGSFPRDFSHICSLPGIGESTAGAIASAAFGQAHPVLDGNVKRVFLRLANCDSDGSRAPVHRQLYAVAKALVCRAEDPFIHNQALMDLGATVCVPNQPRCQQCPLAGQCHGLEAGRAAQLPIKMKRKPVPHYTIAVGIIQRGGQVYIQRRPSKGLLGGLWEFPGGKQESGESLRETVVRELAEELGIEVTVGQEIASIRHAYSHFKITLHAFLCTIAKGDPTPVAATEGRFVERDELRRFAFPQANRKILELL